MSDNKTTITISGGTFLAILALIFIAAKLNNLIDWSWWLVTSPIWFIPAAFVSVVLSIIVTALIVQFWKWFTA